jgi:ABC-type antimicrobial peptide transport system permease subunit
MSMNKTTVKQLVDYLSLFYTLKRLVRSWQLFTALLLGIVLASTFFAGINVGADTAAKQALDQELSKVLVDVVVSPSYDYVTGRSGLLSSENVTKAMDAISDIDGVDEVEVISGEWAPAQVPNKNLSVPLFRLVGISENSRVYDGWIGGAPTIEQNETYFWLGSEDAGLLDVGDVIPLNFSFARTVDDYGRVEDFSFLFNLTVAGFVQLSDEALTIAMGQYYSADIIDFKEHYSGNLLIASWEKTLAELLDFVYNLSPAYGSIGTTICVYLDRGSLISPWDTVGSINNLNAVTFRINNAVSKYYLRASNRLEDTLNLYQGVSFGMRFTFIIAALPVFFVAWYMGSTVSDVSFNLRRREIGLLLTKGFSRRQLFWMFLFEAALIGLLGGLIGIVLSLTLSPWFVAAAGGQFIGVPVIGPDSIVLTVAFAVIITFLSAYRPARRASNMSTVDALREYMYVEEVKQYKRLWPWTAFVLGSFKIVVFLLGINFQAEMMRLGFSPANIFLFFLLSIVVFIDGVLTYIGPFLFFWGFTKIFIRGSLKFQEFTVKATKFLGDLGELATKSVKRNPARAAAVAFLIAFIIGYSVQIVGTLASEQDFGIRETYFRVGSDVSVALSSPTNASQIINTIQNNVSGVESITVEYTFWASTGFETRERMELRAVDLDTWLSAAYYENDLFRGSPVETAFEIMSSNNYTIILECNYAKALDKEVGDVIAVTFGEKKTEELTVVGFFGVESAQTSGGPPQIEPLYFSRQYWSYVPGGLYNELEEEFVGYSSARIMVKLESGADGEAVADQIRELDINVSSVSSVAEQLKERQSNFIVTGSLNILRFGVIFIVIAASVGTALVTLVSLRERKREASIMSVRGLSLKQLVVMLLTENFAIVAFAVLLGAAVGLIVVHGTIASANAFNVFTYTPLSRRMVFPPDALLTLFISFSLVFASTIIPVIFMAKRYSSRLERTVREV